MPLDFVDFRASYSAPTEHGTDLFRGNKKSINNTISARGALWFPAALITILEMGEYGVGMF